MASSGMTENKASAHPEGEKLAAREMRGEGDYTASTRGCFDVINSAAVSCESSLAEHKGNGQILHRIALLHK
jgi:hypothetical protein